jgi:hypothetical protein
MNATTRDRRIRMTSASTDRDFSSPTPTAPTHPTFETWSTPTMNQTNTAAWVTYTYASFAAAAGMTALGIWALPADLWVKGYLGMAVIFLVGSCFTLSKTLRDEHEAKRLTNRLEDAKAEKLLMGIDRT